MQQLTADQVQEFVNDLVGEGLAPRTVKLAIGVLRQALNWAIARRKIRHNVALDVELPKAHKVELTPLSEDRTAPIVLLKGNIDQSTERARPSSSARVDQRQRRYESRIERDTHRERWERKSTP